VWTQRAVSLLEEIKLARRRAQQSRIWPTMNASLTDANAAIFDAAHEFAGCLPGVHEVLRRQGLLSSTACLNPQEKLSPGQAAEITRVSAAYPCLQDDAFVAQHLGRWLA
jgi:hypothetical protein